MKEQELKKLNKAILKAVEGCSPIALYDVAAPLIPYGDEAVPTPAPGIDKEWDTAQYNLWHATLEMRKKNPNLPKIKESKTVHSTCDWCVDAEKATDQRKSKPPEIPKRFRLAKQAEEAALLLAENNGIVLDADRMQIWRYAKDHVNIEGYTVPGYQLFQNYINGYERMQEAQKKYLKETHKDG